MTELLDGCGVAVRWSGSGRQCPTASLRQFSVKLVLAAPASFLPAAALSQDACASFSHFVMKLVSAALESLFALASPLQVSAMAEPAAKPDSKTATASVFIACLPWCVDAFGALKRAREHATIHGGNPF